MGEPGVLARHGRATRWRRVSPALIAIALTLALATTVRPLGSTFWLDHPFWFALVASLGLLLVAAVVVDVQRQRRESRRWRNEASASAGELDIHFFSGQVVMLELLGFDLGRRLDIALEDPVSQARRRAESLLARRPSPQIDYTLYADGPARAREGARRLPILLRDEPWRDQAMMCLQVLASRQSRLIGQWSEVYSAMDDDAAFVTLGATVEVLNLTWALELEIGAVHDAKDPGSPADAAHVEDAVHAAVSRWGELRLAYAREAQRWRNTVRAGHVDHQRWKTVSDEVVRHQLSEPPAADGRQSRTAAKTSD